MIYNQQYTKSDYETFIKQINTVDFPKILEQVKLETIYQEHFGVGNNDPICGNYINNSHNARFCYDADELRDCKYCTIVGQSQDCMDYFSRGLHSSLIYESHNSGQNCQNLLFCDFVRDSSNNIICSYLCAGNNKNLFGCAGLRNKQYCIFNKQYENKEKYEEQVSKIIQHMQTT